MIKRVDHIAIAVRGLAERLGFWSDAMGLEVGGVHTVDSEGVKVAFLPADDTKIELLEPLGADTSVGKFLEKRGEGLHHITFEVSDLPVMLEKLKSKGVQVLGDMRVGAEGHRVAFLHPRSAGGVLVELVEGAEADEPVDDGPIRAGSPVLLYLREPQEKIWGVLRRLDASGATIEGIDLASFDDWVAQVERQEASVAGPSMLFVPMIRVEKMLLDRSSGGLPSLAERFFRRTGRSVQQVIAESAAEADESSA